MASSFEVKRVNDGVIIEAPTPRLEMPSLLFEPDLEFTDDFLDLLESLNDIEGEWKVTRVEIYPNLSLLREHPLLLPLFRITLTNSTYDVSFMRELLNWTHLRRDDVDAIRWLMQALETIIFGEFRPAPEIDIAVKVPHTERSMIEHLVEMKILPSHLARALTERHFIRDTSLTVAEEWPLDEKGRYINDYQFPLNVKQDYPFTTEEYIYASIVNARVLQHFCPFDLNLTCVNIMRMVVFSYPWQVVFEPRFLEFLDHRDARYKDVEQRAIAASKLVHVPTTGSAESNVKRTIDIAAIVNTSQEGDNRENVWSDGAAVKDLVLDLDGSTGGFSRAMSLAPYIIKRFRESHLPEHGMITIYIRDRQKIYAVIR